MIVYPFIIPLGPLQLTGFGLAVVFAFVIAQFISQRMLALRGHDPSPIADLIVVAVIGTLVGAKLYHVVIITHDWRDVFARTGFVFWGGFIGGVAAVLIAIRVKRLRIMPIADAAGVALAAGYSVGRTGCWAVGDDYGRPWSSPFAVRFPDGAPPTTVANLSSQFHAAVPAGLSPETVISVYPTQLFEVALGFVMFVILWRLRRHRHAEGWLFGVYMLLAGIERFIVEIFRAKDDRFFGPISSAQLVAVLVALAGAIWMATRARPRVEPAALAR